MHPVLLFAALTAVWALAPFFGAPASLWVMPLVAAGAAWQTASPSRAALATVGPLAALVVLWSAAVTLDGADPLAQSRTAVGVFVMHAVVVAPLAAGARWAFVRWARRRPAPV